MPTRSTVCLDRRSERDGGARYRGSWLARSRALLDVISRGAPDCRRGQTCDRWRFASPTVRASRSTGGRCHGSAGIFGWDSPHAKGWYSPGFFSYDRQRDRPIIYRASFAELIVPYGDPGPAGYRKCAYDIGEYGIGMFTNSLQLGCDCLGEIHYFDVDLCDDRGEPWTINNAICLHEEDFGLLWKHYDAATDHAEVRRMRRLVVSFIITVGNYDYAFTGTCTRTGRSRPRSRPRGSFTQGLAFDARNYGANVEPDLVAPHHQHFFCVRLDMEVDGERNSVYEVNTAGVADKDANPHGNAFRPVVTRLEREPEAHRTIDPLSGRRWLISRM